MKKIFYILVLLLIYTATTCNAKTVIATGYGDNQPMAIKDALRHAIETSNIAVASASVVENYKTTQDIVVTKSKGYITDYRILEATDKKVKLQAEVDNELDTHLMSGLVKKGIIKSVLEQPVVSVDIPDQEAKAAVIAKLVESGFTIGNDGDIIISSIHSNRTNNGDVGKFLGCSRTNTQSVSSDIIVSIQYKNYNTTISGHGSGVGINSYAAYKMASRKAGEMIASHIEKYLFSLGTSKLLVD